MSSTLLLFRAIASLANLMLENGDRTRPKDDGTDRTDVPPERLYSL